MPETAIRPSVLTLIKNLTTDFQGFIRQEIQLAKTEFSEKISSMGRNAVWLAIGGFVAYAGLIVLLIGIGVLLAFAFEAAGLDTMMSGFLGLASIGLLVSIIGIVLVMKAVKAFSRESLAPQRTLQTIQELRSSGTVDFESEPEHQEQAKPSSEEMQARVEATEYRMSENLEELGQRLSPRNINAQIKKRISAKPYKSGGIALVFGVISGLLLKRKFSRA